MGGRFRAGLWQMGAKAHQSDDDSSWTAETRASTLVSEDGYQRGLTTTVAEGLTRGEHERVAQKTPGQQACASALRLQGDEHDRTAAAQEMARSMGARVTARRAVETTNSRIGQWWPQPPERRYKQRPRRNLLERCAG